MVIRKNILGYLETDTPKGEICLKNNLNSEILKITGLKFPNNLDKTLSLNINCIDSETILLKKDKNRKEEEFFEGLDKTISIIELACFLDENINKDINSFFSDLNKVILNYFKDKYER